jgi:hypothetical protein
MGEYVYFGVPEAIYMNQEYNELNGKKIPVVIIISDPPV